MTRQPPAPGDTSASCDTLNGASGTLVATRRSMRSMSTLSNAWRTSTWMMYGRGAVPLASAARWRSRNGAASA